MDRLTLETYECDCTVPRMKHIDKPVIDMDVPHAEAPDLDFAENTKTWAEKARNTRNSD